MARVADAKLRNATERFVKRDEHEVWMKKLGEARACRTFTCPSMARQQLQLRIF